MPNPVYRVLKRAYRKVHRAGRESLARVGLNAYPTRDFYSPLPVFSEVEERRDRWDRPSEMVGVEWDLEAMKARLAELVARFGGEYQALPSYEEIKTKGFGPGFTVVDAMLIYLTLRDLKPKRYIEIGSGFSTYYSWLAATANRDRDGAPCDMHCVDPYPRRQVRELPGVRVTASRVEDLDLGVFEALEAGDVFFIDTTHVLKLGGDVAYLFLEVVPRLAPGVAIHVHDIHFPYNTPYPAEQYIFNTKWPSYWTEAMLLQAFLAFNDRFAIELSAPMIRHFDEDFLARTIPGYRPVEVTDYDTHFGSIWLRRVK